MNAIVTSVLDNPDVPPPLAGADYVLTLALGPVQGFISAARRSRDLWAGSWILSELSKAAALAWIDAGAQLVFPAVGNRDDLKPGSDLNVGNKLRAVLRGATPERVREVAARGAQAARQHWRQLADEALRQALEAGANKLRKELWQAQVDDYIECYAAWAPMSGGDASYAAAAALSDQALAARKNTRDFQPAARRADEVERMVPKSSLDGARETVLPEQRPHRLKQQLRLADNEQLDVAGVVKRLAGKIDQFTPLTRIAAHDWLQALPEAERASLREAYEPLVALGLASRVKGNEECYRDFPFDAALCFRGQLEQAVRRADAAQEKDALDALQRLRASLRPLWKDHGEPVPYAVMLQADGDRMGALLSNVPTLEGHQQVAQELSEFAKQVPGLLRQYAGHALYAGGDDVLALLPLSGAVAAAKALAQDFGSRMQDAAQRLRASGVVLDAQQQPTLSVGLAVVHIGEPMGIWREQALAAEQVAKGDKEPVARQRNGLAIRLLIRAGHLVQLRARWDDEDAVDGEAGLQRLTTVDWLNRWQEALSASRRTIPSRLAYDLRDLGLQGQRLGNTDDSSRLAQWCEAEWALLCQRARAPKGRPLSNDTVRQLTTRLRALSARLGTSHTAMAAPGITPKGMLALAHELIIARWLGARLRSDLGRDAQ